MPPPPELIETLRQYVEQGVIVPNVTDAFTLEEVPAALRALEAGSTLGRIVIVMP